MRPISAESAPPVADVSPVTGAPPPTDVPPVTDAPPVTVYETTKFVRLSLSDAVKRILIASPAVRSSPPAGDTRVIRGGIRSSPAPLRLTTGLPPLLVIWNEPPRGEPASDGLKVTLNVVTSPGF